MTDDDFGNGGHSGSRCYRFRFLGGLVFDAAITLKQEVRLCLGVNYILKAWTRRPLAKTGCVADFYVDGKIVASSVNGASDDWTETESRGSFLIEEGGGVYNLVVKTTCPGSRIGGFDEFFLDDVTIRIAD